MQLTFSKVLALIALVFFLVLSFGALFSWPWEFSSPTHVWVLAGFGLTFLTGSIVI